MSATTSATAGRSNGRALPTAASGRRSVNVRGRTGMRCRSLFPKTNNAYQVYTTYEHPTQYKIKIMCDEENIYSSYSYLYVDNESPLVPISKGVKKFNEYTDNDSKHYSTFSPSPNDLINNGDGTILSISAIYDSILYERSEMKPFMVTKRSVGSRPVFVRID